jgi:hypothetical protein
MIEYLSGAVTVGFIVASALFMRLWHRRRDRLLLALAIAFTLLAVNQMLALWLTDGHARVGYAYLLRVFGFLLVLAAIADWNRRIR